MNNFFLSILSKQSKMKKTILTIVTLAFMGSSVANAQVGIGTTTPDAAAVLDLTSTTQGFLPPRMTGAERDAIATPAQGLTIFNNDHKCLNVYVGYWRSLCAFDNTDYTGTITHNSLTYEDVYNAATGLIWLDRNLGATQVATSSTDADSYGDLYQWGRGADGHQLREPTPTPTTTQSTTDTPGDALFITGSADWRSTQNDNLWQGVTGINNPCPSGYRLPTDTEWDAERLSWGSNNNAAGAIASPLKLPLAGFRDYSNGSLYNAGSYGFYWSSTVSSTFSRSLYYSSSNANMGTANRAYGYAVRCLKE